jgi:hypothetical protein
VKIMTDRRHEYCSVYVRTSDPTLVRDLLAQVLGARVDRRSLLLPGITIDVRPNPDLSADASHPAEDFVRWPVLIEMNSTQPSAMVAAASSVITRLWEAGHPAIAACDFEDELPWGGGIRRLNSAT